jgi:serine protease Do
MNAIARFPRYRALLVCLLLVPAPAAAQFKDPSAPFTRSNPAFLKAFREVIAKPSESTVRVLSDGKDTALGVIVGPDGWVLTKANDLKGEPTVKLRDGRVFDARWVGAHMEHDLALLKIEAAGLKPIEFTDSKEVAVGSWVACASVSDDPAAIGVVSVATRKVSLKGALSFPPLDLSKTGYLGISLEQGEGHPRISQVMGETPAAKAGLKENDLVIELNGARMTDPDQLVREIGKHKPGDVVALKVRRGDVELDLKATLARRPPGMLRGDMQNRMGSELSSRRGGYPTFFQHDSVVKPQDCGGPIVDLEGRVIGINICRAGRTESWAVPSEVIQPLLLDLMSGKLPPKLEAAKLSPQQELEAVKKALQKAELQKALLDKKIAEAKAELARREQELNKAAAAAQAEQLEAPRRAAQSGTADDKMADSVEAVLKLMQQRLALMKDVAGAKWSAKLPVADPEREAELTDQLVKKGQELGLAPGVVRGFIAAQLEASRQVQEGFFEQWRKQNIEPKASANLHTELRPRIEQISVELLAALAKLQPHLEQATVQERLRDRAAALLAGEGITDAVRQQALAPLVRR